MELRLPNITGSTVEERLSQLQSYLYSTVEQLNWALSTVEKEYSAVKKEVTESAEEETSPEKAEKTFGQLKDLIIKSSDIVYAYKEELERSYDEKYVAQSDIGTYIREGTTAILEGPDGLKVKIDNVETLARETEKTVRENSGYVKIGIIDQNNDGDIIGVEIKDGKEDGSVFARYTSNGTTLFNETGNETLRIANGKTRLTGRVTIEDADNAGASLSLQGYILDPTDGIGLYWGGE